MDSFNNEIKTTNRYLFPGLKSSERIRLVVEKYLLKDLEKIGFKINSSQTIRITRKFGDFKHEIYLQQFSWNGTELVTFLPHFIVRSPLYLNWHKKVYGIAPTNKDIIMETDSFNMTNWDMKKFGSMYNLSTHDNVEVIENIKINLDKAAIPYLNALADKKSVTEYIMKSNSYFYKAPMLFDFAYLQNDKDQAKTILNWFDSKAKEGLDFSEQTLNDIKTRNELLNNWA